MRRSKNRERDIETVARVGFALAALAVLAYQFSPAARAAMQGIFQLLLLAFGVIAMAAAGWLLIRAKGRRRVPVPVEFLPRARVVDFPPQAHEKGPVRVDLSSQPRPAPATAPPPAPRVVAASPSFLSSASSSSSSASFTQELVERLHSLDWFQFEKLTEAIYGSLGYEVSRWGGANPDGGIDLILEKNGEVVAIQCKHWKSWKVNVKSMREFLGALLHAKIKRGIYITLKGYTEDARQLAADHDIEILTDTGLAQLLDKSGARFDPFVIAVLKETRKFCPKCEAEMVVRTAAKGEDGGKRFWGCSNFPECRQIMEFAG